jgi:hypothetical protein
MGSQLLESGQPASVGLRVRLAPTAGAVVARGLRAPPNPRRTQPKASFDVVVEQSLLAPRGDSFMLLRSTRDNENWYHG